MASFGGEEKARTEHNAYKLRVLRYNHKIKKVMSSRTLPDNYSYKNFIEIGWLANNNLVDDFPFKKIIEDNRKQ